MSKYSDYTQEQANERLQELSNLDLDGSDEDDSDDEEDQDQSETKKPLKRRMYEYIQQHEEDDGAQQDKLLEAFEDEGGHEEALEQLKKTGKIYEPKHNRLMAL